MAHDCRPRNTLSTTCMGWCGLLEFRPNGRHGCGVWQRPNPPKIAPEDHAMFRNIAPAGRYPGSGPRHPRRSTSAGATSAPASCDRVLQRLLAIRHIYGKRTIGGASESKMRFSLFNIPAPHHDLFAWQTSDPPRGLCLTPFADHASQHL